MNAGFCDSWHNELSPWPFIVGPTDAVLGVECVGEIIVVVLWKAENLPHRVCYTASIVQSQPYGGSWVVFGY